MDNDAGLQVPADVLGSGKDLLDPLQQLLQGLNLLPKTDKDGNFEKATWSSTPQSVAILESGASSIVKGWTVFAGALGGAGVITAGIKGFWQGSGLGVQSTLVWAAAIVAAAAILAIALMVVTDLRNRTRGTLAVYEIRKAVALDFVSRAVDASTSTIRAPGGRTATDQEESASSRAALIVALAAARSTASVRCDNTYGHLVGLQQDKGKTKVRFRPIDKEADISLQSPADVTLIQLDY